MNIIPDGGLGPATIIDVSNVNGAMNWDAVRRAGIRAAYLKATEGLTFNDRDFSEWRRAANKAGVRIGAYHFARPDLHPNGAVAEAHHFIQRVGKVGRTDLKPVLDFETAAPNMTVSRLESWARKFSQDVHTHWNLFPVFYSYPAFVKGMRLTKTIGSGLWIAAYSKNDGREHPFEIPAPWKHYLAHQYTSRATFRGHAGFVDFSHAPSLRALLAHPIIGV